MSPQDIVHHAACELALRVFKAAAARARKLPQAELGTCFACLGACWRGMPVDATPNEQTPEECVTCAGTGFGPLGVHLVLLLDGLAAYVVEHDVRPPCAKCGTPEPAVHLDAGGRCFMCSLLAEHPEAFR